MRANGIILATLAAVSPASCSSSPPRPLPEAIVGKWTEIRGMGEVLEFSADGRFATYYQKGDARRDEMTGTYTVEGDRVRLESKGRTLDLMQAEVNGDYLTYRAPPRGDRVQYRRAE